ncbi:hypothetical protein [Georgenia sp. SUBG003]|uniref:hypothetical protein n=1 Tax=Georgenia sp. SUBG003 TaxID=1497974 RepID=UPI003AB64442
MAMLIVAEARESAEPLIAEAARHAAVARREDGTLVELTAGRVFLRSDRTTAGQSSSMTPCVATPAVEER